METLTRIMLCHTYPNLILNIRHSLIFNNSFTHSQAIKKVKNHLASLMLLITKDL